MKISWSGLVRWEECPYQDHQMRQGARSPLMDGRNFLAGTVVDNTMRAYLVANGDLDVWAEREKQFAKHTGPDAENAIKWRNAEDRSVVEARTKEALERLLPWLEREVLPFDYQAEARGVGTIAVPDLAGELQRVDLFFAVDILVRKPSGLFTIYDLKTTTSEAYTSGKTLAQLTFYGVALAAHLGIGFSDFERFGFITPLLKNDAQEVRPDLQDARVLISRVHQYALGVWSGKYPTKPALDNDCTYKCPVKHVCPLVSPVKVGREISLTETAAVRRAAKEA